MTTWYSTDWFQRHAIAAPFGITVTTVLLFWLDQGHWAFWQDLQNATSLVDFGAVIYATVAIVVDGGGRVVFYTIAKWKEDKARREKLLEELLRKQRLENLAEFQAEFLEELRQRVSEGGTLEDWLNEKLRATETNGSSP